MTSEKSVMAVIRATRASFRNHHDKVAFALHATFIASGYVLTATGRSAFSDTASSSSSSIMDEVSIEGWNDSEDEYVFIYGNPNPDSNWKKLIVKCFTTNEKLFIDALIDNSSEPLHLEIDVEEFVNNTNGLGLGLGKSNYNYTAQYKNFETLVKRFHLQILSKLEDDPTRGRFIDRGELAGSNDPRWVGFGSGGSVYHGGQPIHFIEHDGLSFPGPNDPYYHWQASGRFINWREHTGSNDPRGPGWVGFNRDESVNHGGEPVHFIEHGRLSVPVPNDPYYHWRQSGRFINQGEHAGSNNNNPRWVGFNRDGSVYHGGQPVHFTEHGRL